MSKKETLPNKCKCAELCNKELAKSNLALRSEMMVNFKTGDIRIVTPIIQLIKTGPRKGSIPPLFVAYCPFCGRKIEADEQQAKPKAKAARKKAIAK